ncbi:MAG: hypothetical protein IPM54_18980 [Polyangiaceae bacterium]|nr:hypothetical protein [Polyangiaceae bacterium]
MNKVMGTAASKRLALGAVLSVALGLACACGGSAASTEGQTPKTPAAPALPACEASDVCTDLATCLLTSKEHLDAFNCRACSDEAVKACEDPTTCPIRDASSVEALVCRAIRKEMACKDATAVALEAWRKDGEPPFLDEGILRKAVSERYARQAKPALGCPAEPVKANP